MAFHSVNQWAHAGWGASITLAYGIAGHLVIGAMLMGTYALTKEMAWDVPHDHQPLSDALVDVGFYWLGIIGAIMFTTLAT